MYNLNTFKENCKAFLKNQTVVVRNSVTKSQQKFEFEQELKRKIRNLKTELSKQADEWGDLAFKNGHPDISKLRSDMKNAVRTILRDWKVEQEDNSGLYD